MSTQDQQGRSLPEENQPIIDVESNAIGEKSAIEKEELLDAAKKIVEDRRKKPKSTLKKGKKKEETDWSAKVVLLVGSFVTACILVYALFGMITHRANKPPTRRIAEDSILPAVVRYGGEDIPGKSFVGLEATRTDRNPELIDEVKKVIDSGGAPSEVFKNDVPQDTNIAGELRRQFEIYRQNPGELESLRRENPYLDDKVDPTAVRNVSDILERTEPKRLQIRQMLNNKDACFSFEFITLPPDPTQPDLGEIPETGAVDFLSDYALLEEYAVARSLLNGDIRSAMESLAYIFRLAQLAAEVKNPGIRIQAGQIRLHALEVLQVVVLDSNLKETDLAYLYAMLQEQLDYWTPDAEAWIGDRASGMKVYNLILQYGLDVALEPDEIEEMQLRGIYESMKRNLNKTLASDQIFYLRSMQLIVDSCQRPFYQRLDTLNLIDGQLREAQGTPDETIIAEFLLRGIRDRMFFCAQDRTKCEMAALAMATSLKNTKITFRSSEPRTAINPKETIEMLILTPLYGKKYEVRQIRDDDNKRPMVWVSYLGNLKPFRVLDFSFQ